MINIKDFICNYNLRKRMKKLFSKFYSFDIVDDIPNILFAMFIEFYEHGGIDSVNWVHCEEIINQKKRIDKIYLYAKYLRKKWVDKADYILDQSLYVENKSERNQKIFKVYNWMESFICNCDSKYCIEIINLRGILRI